MHRASEGVPVPGPGQGRRGEEGHLGYLLRQAAGVHRQRMDRALADLGVTLPQFAVMTMLQAYPGISNADVARVALLTPQTVSVIVANLERAGTIERVKHGVHGRILRITLTAEGGVLLKRCRTRVGDLERNLAAALSQAEQETVRAWLVRVAQAPV